MLDSNGEIFAAHDYKHFYKITNAPNYADYLSDNAFAPPSKDYINNAKIYGRFTPLNKDMINAIFRANPDIFLVTDKLRDFSALANQLNFGKDRLIIEVFDWRDYFRARKMGFKYPAFCVWDNPNEIKKAMRLKIPIITMHTQILQTKIGQELSEEFIKNGGCIFSFSSNQKDFIDAHRGKNVSAFYVDYYDIGKNECKLRDKGKCETY